MENSHTTDNLSVQSTALRLLHAEAALPILIVWTDTEPKGR